MNLYYRCYIFIRKFFWTIYLTVNIYKMLLLNFDFHTIPEENSSEILAIRFTCDVLADKTIIIIVVLLRMSCVVRA